MAWTQSRSKPSDARGTDGDASRRCRSTRLLLQCGQARPNRSRVSRISPSRRARRLTIASPIPVGPTVEATAAAEVITPRLALRATVANMLRHRLVDDIHAPPAFLGRASLRRLWCRGRRRSARGRRAGARIMLRIGDSHAGSTTPHGAEIPSKSINTGPSGGGSPSENTGVGRNGSKRFGEQVRCAHDRPRRSGTASARAHPPELLHPKSGPHKRANWRQSSAREENLGFWVDDEAKTLTFLDNTPLTVTRLDQFWISADRDGIFYEFDRRDGTLSYASSTTKGGVSTTIVGSGRCEAPPTEMR
jgi:hypothetical protein